MNSLKLQLRKTITGKPPGRTRNSSGSPISGPNQIHEDRVPQQNLAIALTKVCFEVMLLTQKCFRRISLTKLDFQNKTQCTLYGDSWEREFSSDVGAKSSYNHSEKLVSLYSSSVSSSRWLTEAYSKVWPQKLMFRSF